VTLIDCRTAEKAFKEIQCMLEEGYRLNLHYDAKRRTYHAAYRRNDREIVGAGDSWIAAVCEAALLKELKSADKAS
jgi:hypothetical protein